jgi:hypothetical protein
MTKIQNVSVIATEIAFYFIEKEYMKWQSNKYQATDSKMIDYLDLLIITFFAALWVKPNEMKCHMKL